jgi:hypothetical protein
MTLFSQKWTFYLRIQESRSKMTERIYRKYRGKHVTKFFFGKKENNFICSFQSLIHFDSRAITLSLTISK